jgi:hypothetical protein
MLASEEIRTIVHALPDKGRKQDIRALATKVEVLEDLLSQARIRLDQHIGMCACPGMPCVTACRECNTTQDLVNRIREFMRGISPK